MWRYTIGRTAKYISGDKKPKKNKSLQDRLKLRKDDVTPKTKRRRGREIAAEIGINNRRPTAALGGYFRYNNDAPVKKFSQEEIDKLNAELEDDS